MKMDLIILPLVVAVGVLMLAAPGVCRPGGAPRQACVSMMPGHGAQSTDPVPYRIYITDHNYNPVYRYRPGRGLHVNVDVLGDYKYRGILMQMREVGSTVPVGTWKNVANNTRTLTCSYNGDSVTHKNTIPKGKGQFIWTAPNREYRYPLEVRATIAAEMSTWWMNVTSSSITSAVSPRCSRPNVIGG